MPCPQQLRCRTSRCMKQLYRRFVGKLSNKTATVKTRTRLDTTSSCVFSSVLLVKVGRPIWSKQGRRQRPKPSPNFWSTDMVSFPERFSSSKKVNGNEGQHETQLADAVWMGTSLLQIACNRSDSCRRWSVCFSPSTLLSLQSFSQAHALGA